MILLDLDYLKKRDFMEIESTLFANNVLRTIKKQCAVILVPSFITISFQFLHRRVVCKQH
jgi:hypothetical protein